MCLSSPKSLNTVRTCHFHITVVSENRRVSIWVIETTPLDQPTWYPLPLLSSPIIFYTSLILHLFLSHILRK